MIHYLYNYFLTRKPDKKKSKLYVWLQWQLYKYLKIYLVKNYKKIDKRTLGIDTNSNVIVSLTSFPARIDVIYLSIISMLNQITKPQKIVLWLGIEQFPLREEGLPNSLLELKPFGLEIEFCKDLKAHKKYYFAFQKYPNDLVVTVDDDVLYPRNLLLVLLENHQKFPNSVVANRVRFMETEGDGFKPYRQWPINILLGENPSKKLFSTGVGGVLYQPHLFKKTFYDLEGIKKTNCIGDDIWLKAGQISNNIPVVFTNFYFRQFIEIPESQTENLYSTNVFNSDNDRQIKAVFAYFGLTLESFK
ncbi:hypothetical protein [Formosa sp. PL04]|uniref:hypothetical protein n=1 Tax=Formosa sp. PL04 TaxID=3081755 RepID=UPI0029813091|nr:hypothetical protein [Formosa sp. PL04]MDW5290741.1 hypothetical protein [Formosa sp. PL04]